MIFWNCSIHTNKQKTNLLRFVLSLAIAFLSTSALARDNKVIDVNLKEQSASSSLVSLAKQANIEIVMPESAGSHKTTALKGQYTLTEVFKKLLIGSGLTYEFVSDDSVVIKDNKIAVLTDAEESEDATEEEQFDDDENVITITVKKRVLTRNRVDGIAPMLSYPVEYFQRFEPNNLQEMLKRVPGIITESLIPFSATDSAKDASGVVFRGLRGSAGQILINGRRVPGVTEGNALSLSNIPAGIIQEVQIIRAATARFANEGTGLTINVILKDGESIGENESLTYRVGYRSSDGEPGYNLELQNTGDFGEFRYSANLAYSDRRTVGEFPRREINNDLDPNDARDEFFNRSSQNRSKHLAFNGSLTYLFDHGGELTTQFFWSETDNSDRSSSSILSLADYTRDALSDATSQFDTETYNIALLYNDEFFDSVDFDTSLSFSKSTSFGAEQSRTDQRGGRFGQEPRPDPSESELNSLPFLPSASSRSDREELVLDVKLNWSLTDVAKLNTGLQLNRSDNFSTSEFLVTSLDTEQLERGIRIGDPTFSTQKEREESASVFLELELQFHESLGLNIGSRYFRLDTESDGTYQQPGRPLVEERDQFGESSTPTPSAMLKWSVSRDHTLRLSWSTAVDKPDIDELGSFEIIRLVEDGPLDPPRIILGNPNLNDSEVSTWELGYDYRLAEGEGVIGVAVYRKDLVGEIINLDFTSRSEFLAAFPELRETLDGIDPALAPVGFRDYSSFKNSTADSFVTGLDFDFSLPLGLIGIPDLSIQGNFTYLKDEKETTRTDDSFSTSNKAYNITLDYQYKDWGFGVSYNYLGVDETLNIDEDSQILSKSKKIRDPSLDMFIKRDFETFSVNLAVENVLDAKEIFITENTTFDGDVNSVRHNSSELGPQFILSVRGRF